MAGRVSPTERARAEIDELFASDRDHGDQEKKPGLTRRASKELRDLAKDGAKRGWSVETLGSGPIRFTKPGRKPLVTGPTSTDWRTIKNMRAAIEREQDE